MKDRFIGYGRQWIDDSDIAAVTDSLRRDFLTQGPAVEQFEKVICERTGAQYCAVVANGTAALHLAVTALEIEKGCEGITSPLSFVASANCLVYNNLIPSFADIDEKTYTINPSEIKRKVTTNTRIIIPVHYAGQTADMEAIHQIARDKRLYVIEDAAHALGSKYRDCSPVGNCRFSDMTIFSFHPVKTITTGEGGAITTNNRELYDRLVMLRSHGITRKSSLLSQNPGPWYYEMQNLGFNYRLTDIQAALGISQMKRLDAFIQRRREIVNRYNKELSGIAWATVPYEAEPRNAAFHLYVLQIDFRQLGKSRSQVMEELSNKQIGTQVHYIPIHTQPYYKNIFKYSLGYFPVAELFYEKSLSIPLFPAMTDKEVERVINGILSLDEKR